MGHQDTKLTFMRPRLKELNDIPYSMSPLPGLIQTIQTIRTQFKPNSNHSNPIQTQFKPFKPKLKPSSNPIQTVQTHLEPKLEIHVSSHATRDSEGGSNSRSYRHDKLNNQLPSVLFCFCTHKKNKFFVIH